MSEITQDAAQRAPGPDQAWDIDANDESLPVLQGLQPRWGDVVRVPTVTRPKDSLVVFDPDHLKWILLTNRQNYRKGVGLERVRMLLGNGLIVSDGDFWARQRRMMQPAFHSRVIKQFAGVIERHNAAFCRAAE